jgi:Leucine-rich repeat (LRR) protein
MKRILLQNPEQAHSLFKKNKWTETDEFFIKVCADETESILLNAKEVQSEAQGNALRIKLGSEYIIPLEEYGDEILFNFSDIVGLGALLSINGAAYFLRVYDHAKNEQISEIGTLFPTLRIIDFGSGKNEAIQNLNGIKNCTELHTLNLDNCKNLNDISILPSFEKLKTLWIDRFEDASQFHYIGACTALEKLSQNSCKLTTLHHLAGLSNLKRLSIHSNKNLSDLSPLAELTQLKTLNLSCCKELSDLSPLAELTQLQNLDLSSCENLSDLTPLAGLSQLQTLDLSHCKNLSNLSPLAGLTQLQTLNLSHCKNLSNLSPLAGLTQLQTLNLSHCKNLSNLSPLAGLTQLQTLNLRYCENLSDFSPLAGLFQLKTLNLGHCKNLSNLSPLAGLSQLQTLDLSFCENLSNLSPLAELTQLQTLNLSFCENLSDLTPLAGLSQLQTLNLSHCKKLSDLSPLAGLTQLQTLDLSGEFRTYINIRDLSPLAELTQLQKLDLSYLENLSDLSPLAGLSQLQTLNLYFCGNLNDLSPLAGLSQLKTLNLSLCKNLCDLSPLAGLSQLQTLDLKGYRNDISPLAGLTQLQTLNLKNCDNLSDLSPLSGLSQLQTLDLSHCKNLSNLSPLAGLSQLQTLDLSHCPRIVLISTFGAPSSLSSLILSNSPNIRDFHHLSKLPQLKELKWIDPVACSEVIMQCASNREDINYIMENMKPWCVEIELSKDANSFASKLLTALHFTDVSFQYEHLGDIASKMRRRGLQSETGNDIDIYSWEHWTSLVCALPLIQALECLDAVISEADIVRETEVLLGSVIVAYSDLAERYPEEKNTLLQRVSAILQLIEGYKEETRQIAPSAALFYAVLKMQEEVLHWLDKATDEKAPQWRERVLMALIKYYGKKENFAEARCLLDEMKIQDMKDLAITELAESIAEKYPVEAGFLLDEIRDLRVSSSAAQKMLSLPAMFTKPQAIYQLLLHLQETPEELADCIEAILQKDKSEKTAEAIRALFLQPISTGPSASKLLELCAHEAVGEFVKPRALDKFKTQLREQSAAENATAIPQFISALQEQNLINTEEAAELLKLMI